MMNRNELINSLNNKSEFWRNLEAEEIGEHLGISAATMYGYEQDNPHHCYDLYTHTMVVLHGLPDEAPMNLRVAALFHDIAKPLVAVKKKNRTIFAGHAVKSAKIADAILTDMGFEGAEKEEILFYICHHDDFILWCLPSEIERFPSKKTITQENVCQYLDKIKDGMNSYGEVHSILENLFYLCTADINAQSECVYVNGKLSDSRLEKHERLKHIRELIMVSINKKD